MSEKPLVIIDERERNSEIPELLVKKGVTIKFRQLPVGDYLISDRIAIERKTLRDFVKSIYDGRFFDQCIRLKEAYEIPLMIVEGDLNELPLILENLNVFRGALISASLDYNIKIFYSLNKEETTDIIALIAKQEKKKTSYEYPLVKGKPPILKDLKHWQLYIVQSLPGIGSKSAEKLLESFKTVKNIFNASEKELAKLIGEKKAKKIFEIINKKYLEEDLSSFSGEK